MKNPVQIKNSPYAQTRVLRIGETAQGTVIIDHDKRQPSQALELSLKLLHTNYGNSASIKLKVYGRGRVVNESIPLRLKPNVSRKYSIRVNKTNPEPFYKIEITTHRAILLMVDIRAK